MLCPLYHAIAMPVVISAIGDTLVARIAVSVMPPNFFYATLFKIAYSNHDFDSRKKVIRIFFKLNCALKTFFEKTNS